MGKRTNTAVWLEKHNRWQIKVQKDGERKTFTSSKPGRTGQREANAKADAWLDDNIVNQSAKVSTVFEEYLSRVKSTTGTSNYIQIKGFADNWIIPKIGHIKIGSITEGHLQSVIDNTFEKGKISRKSKENEKIYTGEKHSKKTLNDLSTTIKGFMKYCRKHGYTTLFPENLTIPKNAAKNEKRILQPKEIAIVFSTSKTTYRRKEVEDHTINAYRLQILTGLRPGELLGLEWNDISGSQVTLRRSYNKFKEITKGKNDNAIRTFVLSPEAMEVVDAQRQMSTTERLFDYISQENLSDQWKRYCKHNNITAISPYELRHTFVSAVKELPPGELKPLIGHSVSMDTFGWYGHEAKGDQEKLAIKIGNIFKEILSTET